MRNRSGTRHVRRASKPLMIVVALACVLCCVGWLVGHVPRASATTPGQSASTLAWTTDNRVYYGKYNTPVFTAADQEGRVTFAYCVDPTTTPPAAQTYATMGLSSLCGTSDLVRAALWFGYGGPGFDASMWPDTWEDGSAMDAGKYYAATHLILSYAVTQKLGYVYYNSGSSFIAYAASTFLGIDLYGQVLNANSTMYQMFNRSGEVPGDFVCYALDCGEWDYTQYIVTADYYRGQVAPGALDIQKSSSLSGVTDGNGLYTLAGARYGVYSDEGCTTLVTELTTDEQGRASASDLEEGRYWVKELAAPAGYRLDDSIHDVTVVSEQTSTLALSDDPLYAVPTLVAQKVDASTGSTPQGSATLGGAEFTVRYYAGAYDVGGLPAQATRTWVFVSDEDGGVPFDDAHLVAGDALYHDASGAVAVPLGTLVVQETKAPSGYLLSDASPHLFKAAQGADGSLVFDYQVPTVSDEVVRGGVELQKADADTGLAEAQGNATLQGATFAVVSLNEHPVVVDGTAFAYGETVLTLTTDASGRAATARNALPYGTYAVSEVQAPEGYDLSDASLVVTVSENGLVQQAGSFSDAVARGGVGVRKADAESADGSAQGGATLAGARFSVTNESAAPVVVNGTSYGPGEVVAVIETDESGTAATGDADLPFGTYSIREVSAPEGYLLGDAPAQTVEVTEGGAVAMAAETVTDEVVRGGLQLQKVDVETGLSVPLADATLAGTRFSVTNASDAAVLVDGSWYGPGEVVAVLSTDAGGYASTSADLLPYGTYEVVETSAPEGYTVDLFVQSVCVTAQGEVVSCPVAFSDRVVRGDVAGTKVETDGGSPLAGVAFLVTSLTTGERHVLVTDGDGVFSTASGQAAHSCGTNANDGALNGNDVVDESVLSSKNGVWFSGSAGSATCPDDSVGALPFDVYRFDELLTSASYGHTLVSFTVAVREDGAVVSLGTVGDDVIELGTSAVVRETGLDEGPALEGVHVADTVSYRGLQAGAVYELRASLVYRDSGEAVLDEQGEPVQASKSFTAGQSSGEEEVVLDVDASALAGKKVTVLERLYWNGDEIAAHADRFDENQTVSFVAISTTAHGATSLTHEEQATSTTAIVDEVSYTGLTPGRTYKVSGVLVDAASGTELLGKRGKTVTCEAEFVPTAESGKLDLAFEIDASNLEGRTVVVFEELSRDGSVIAEHADKDAAAQSVTLLGLHTLALDARTGTHDVAVDASASVVDTVTYSGLVPGERYELQGVLVDAETAAAVVDAQGSPASVNLSFVPEEADGSVDVVFDLDASDLLGHVTVATETLLHDGTVVASHADLSDKGQTVRWVKESIPILGEKGPVGLAPSALVGLALVLAGSGAFLVARKQSTLIKP